MLQLTVVESETRVRDVTLAEEVMKRLDNRAFVSLSYSLARRRAAIRRP
jgi:hypothetical protein